MTHLSYLHSVKPLPQATVRRLAEAAQYPGSRPLSAEEAREIDAQIEAAKREVRAAREIENALRVEAIVPEPPILPGQRFDMLP